MIRVLSEVPIREIEGKTANLCEVDVVKVLSHWNQDRLVVLDVGGKRVTVDADDLRAAITNATNSRRFG